MNYNIIKILTFLILSALTVSCTDRKEKMQMSSQITEEQNQPDEFSDNRISLDLMPMQKQHQLSNMRNHLEAVQTIISLISKDEFEKASEVAYSGLGTTTEMQLMCASFGNKEFENLGLEFHKSADEMSEIIKTGDKNKSLEALSKTLNYCITCHSNFKQ